MAAKTPISAPLGRVSDADTYPLIDNNDAINALVFRATSTERDKIPLDMRTGCLCIVYADKKAYKWSGSTWDEYYFPGGVVVADTDGAIPSLRHSLIFDDSFAVQSAGDVGAGVMISLSDAIKQSISEKAANAAMTINGKKFTNLRIMPPLQLDNYQGEDRMLVTPGTYEAHHAEGYLAYFDNEEVIVGTSAETNKHAGIVWADKVAWGAGNTYLYEDRTDKSVILQETDQLDPNVTGGTPILCALHLSFVGKAFGDGTITAYLIDRMTGNPLTSGGQPIGVTKHYKQGQEFEDLSVAEIYMAKGSTKAAWKIYHTFNDDPIKLKDWLEGDSCVLFQAMSGKEEASVPLNQFQIATGHKIEFERKYYGVDMFSIKGVLYYDVPEQLVGANTGEVSNLGIAMLNPSPLKTSIQNHIINFKDDGTHLGYFMLGEIFSQEDTKNMRGKAFTAKSVISDKYDATNVYLVRYVGDVSNADMYFLKGTQNMQPILASGWTIVHKLYEPEEFGGGYDTIGGDFTVPSDADLIAFMVGPQSEQSPMDLSIKDFNVSAKNPYTVYETAGVRMNGGVALKFNNTVAQFHTNALRWTINSSKTNLPFGQRKDGNAPINLTVKEDDASVYSGGLKVEESGLLGVRVYVNVYLGESAKATGSTTNFWVEDQDGNKIPDSDAPATVIKAKDGTAHHFSWEFNFTASGGEVLYLYAQSSVDDGAFVQNASYDAVGTLVNFRTV